MKPRLIKTTNKENLAAVVQCPKCERKAWVDREQFEGKVSMVCECGWHETHDLRGEKPLP